MLSFIPHTKKHLYKLLEELHKRGNILLLKNEDDIDENSWLILDQSAILSEVTGKIFAPNSKDFQVQQCKNLATSTGIVPYSKIKTYFPNFDSNLIVEYLCHFEFCYEITNTEDQQLLQTVISPLTTNGVTTATSPEMSNTTHERFFFFPHLLKLDAPGHVWKPSDEFNYHSAWILQCSNPEDFFTHRFLHVIILRLAFGFALPPDTPTASGHPPSIQRKCSIWKNGIHWGDRSGTEVLVEVVEGRKRVNLIVRCSKGKEIDCIKTRSSLIQKILTVKNELCSPVPVNEFIVHPVDATCYPLKSMLDMKLASCSEIAIAIAEAECSVVDRYGRTMDLDTLLHYEPYVHLGKDILQELFHTENPNNKKVVSTEFLYRLADCIYLKKDIFVKIFKLSTTLLHEHISLAPRGPTHELVEVFKMWRDDRNCNDGSYQCLHRKLDSFSIFAKRNPLVSLLQIQVTLHYIYILIYICASIVLDYCWMQCFQSIR